MFSQLMNQRCGYRMKSIYQTMANSYDRTSTYVEWMSERCKKNCNAINRLEVIENYRK